MRLARLAPALGANVALAAGLILMPVVIAAGFLAESRLPASPSLSPASVELRGSFDGQYPVAVSGPRR